MIIQPAVPVLAHAGGIDEMLFVLVPLLVFLALQWASRRRPPPEPADHSEIGKHERRVRLAGGLVTDAEARRVPMRPDPDDASKEEAD